VTIQVFCFIIRNCALTTLSHFFFATPQPPRLRHARLKTVTPPPNRDDGDAGTKNREKISHALLAVEEKLCWFPSDAKEAKK